MMRTAIAILIGLAAFVTVSSSCTSAPEKPQNTGRPFPMDEYETEERDPHVIVKLESRRFAVTITASAYGPLYTVATHDGRVLIENLTEYEMHAANPDLYEQIFGRYARDEEGEDAPAADASATFDAAPADLFELLGDDAAALLTEPTASAALIHADVDVESDLLFDDGSWF